VTGSRLAVGQAITTLAYHRGRLELIVPKRQGAKTGRSGRGDTAPSPLAESVLDLITWFDWTVLGVVDRCELMLGDRPRQGRLHDTCPYCGWESLFYSLDSGLVKCANTGLCRDGEGRPHIWPYPDGWRRLGELLLARDLETAGPPVGDQEVG
jgi:hypothetical protein